MASNNDPIVIRVNIPSLKLQKAIRVKNSDYVWMLRNQLEEKVASEIKDILNYGVFLHGKAGKKGKFLDERNSIGSYHVDGNSQIDFLLKCKINGESDPKKQKKMLEDIKRADLEKVKEKTTKTFDFNFMCDQESPVACAAMNNDAQMIMWLMDNGAFLDYRMGEKDHWKTPLHIAAQHNKPLALKTLLQFGAWVDATDTLGLTPLYYAVLGGNTECVLRLLLAKAHSEGKDENGRCPLHHAAQNNFDCIAALLLDFGADPNVKNVGGNTPLHVAATRNSKEAIKWLLKRGAKPDILNTSGKTAYELALATNCAEACELLTNFNPENTSIPCLTIVPPPPRLTVEITEIDNVVQHLLSSLTSSIGKEYTPEPYYSKSGRAPQTVRRAPSVNDSKRISTLESGGSELSLIPPKVASRNTLVSPTASEYEISTPAVAVPEEVKETPLEKAWKKVQHGSAPPAFGKLKSYILENAGNQGAKEVVESLEKLESGFLGAVAEWERLQAENQALVNRLKAQNAK